MIHSMTGYGRSQSVHQEQSITVEIKSINSKSFDVRMRLPLHYQSKEMDLRRILNQRLKRGKVDLNLNVLSNSHTDYKIDSHAFEAYFYQLQELAGNLGIDKGDLLYTVSRLPGVVVQNEDEVSDDEWQLVKDAVEKALDQLQGFRAEEGAAMHADMTERINWIVKLLAQVPEHEEARLERVRQRLQTNLEQFRTNNKIDENRFEQELIYYIDKLDINEEKTRLQQHCQYFLQVMDDEDLESKGKKLNFIIQEIGREINTLGAKANYAELQRIVVQMKDEADKIKEQLGNVL
jgi:uncharacterized protein (TIGR00255 family)